ncbi:low molecular weight protein-tyrosine-phosphatase [Iodobacter ciconiae]|uniref:protein-tyrosine-phosphatase n=1 Tax=Iodobacter ciconiae TaxID=2496266 RepID=A0A3S8ZS92_9NEIS|nr:low molecular weight protein-tyrosine-phosphatase [Iodobacter ciconiae]AZN36328.1 low molecular weight phosphotyrosine protein phosphatase [Iodobacter ciconiae]
MKKFKVLFVCTGNICRSPSADGVMRRMLADAGLEHVIGVDSAGTQRYHVGDAPDARSQKHAGKRGYDLSFLRARAVELSDFAEFDLIFAMDKGHLRALQSLCPSEFSHKVKLFLSILPDSGETEVADPYYGGAAGFETVLDQCEAGCAALLKQIKALV